MDDHCAVLVGSCWMVGRLLVEDDCTVMALVEYHMLDFHGLMVQHCCCVDYDPLV